MTAATSDTQVREYLGTTGAVDDGLAPVVKAVNALIIRWFGDDIPEWEDDIVTGATMLASRIWRRRNSPAGVESFGELGPIYVQRNDPDIALLLGLGNYQRPAVG